MIKVVETYTQASFEYNAESFLFRGTFNVNNDNSVGNISAQIIKDEVTVGSLSKSSANITLSVYKEDDYGNLATYAETVPVLIEDLKNYLSNQLTK